MTKWSIDQDYLNYLRFIDFFITNDIVVLYYSIIAKLNQTGWTCHWTWHWDTVKKIQSFDWLMLQILLKWVPFGCEWSHIGFHAVFFGNILIDKHQNKTFLFLFDITDKKSVYDDSVRIREGWIKKELKDSSFVTQ